MLPVDHVDGGDTWQLGQVADFVATPIAELEGLRDPRPLNQWITQLEVMLDRMTATTPKAAWMTRRVRNTLDELRGHGDLAGSALALTIEALPVGLSGRFEVASGGVREQTGAVTFCAMVPMRSIPYKVVCLLGMDERAFPRRGQTLAFDLTHREPRIGDRNLRDEERFLLLEALLAAREHRVVLCTGWDVRSNERRAPAVPVSELCDVIDATLEAPGGAPTASRWLTTERPLQAFSNRNFQLLHQTPERRDEL